jgi:signal transduction histidine kinase
MDDMPTIWCDRVMINQIFTNLITNANKFMGDDNKNPTIEIGYENNQDGVYQFYVKDNGIGIDAAYHDKIFRIFQRLDDVETEGTGVGLAIVKKMVESSGGKIWVDSVLGRGTTMYFTVPQAEGAHEEE